MAHLALQIFACLLLPLLGPHANAQDEFQSPCPRLFVYEGKNNEPDKWYGIVTLLSESDLSGIWLRLIFDRPSLQLGNWFGEVVTTDNKEYLIKNRNHQLKAHVPQTVRFFLKYNPNETPPKLMSFRLNAKTVCPEGAIEDQTTKAPELHLSGTAGGGQTTPNPMAAAGGGRPGGAANGGGGGGGGNFWNQGPPTSGEDEEFYPGDFNFFNRPNQPGAAPSDVDINEVCGTVITKDPNSNERSKRQYPSYPYQYQNYRYSYPHYHNQYQNDYYRPNYDDGISNRVYTFVRNLAQPRPLITYGQETHEGEFPWHAALYHAKGIDLAYICGASLITKYHVITVAHCVTRRKSQTPLNPDNLVVYLGKYYLKRFSSPGIQDRQVAQILPHPQYSARTYSNDIALVKFTNPAEITDYVRPVCLWQESNDLSTVLNKQGKVVGWGFDETGKVTETLMQAKMPIVSQETCIFSFPDFYSRFTSSNTFCAGFRNGTSVCNGDSGGGMVFPKPGSSRNNPVWQLRGLVSISVALQTNFKCDASHYVVFTDAAKYQDWVKNAIK